MSKIIFGYITLCILFLSFVIILVTHLFAFGKCVDVSKDILMCREILR